MAKGQHKSDKEQYAGYKTLDKRQKNREAKLARHAKKHPNDKQSASAKEVKPYKVKPHTKGNFPDATAKLHDPVTGQPMHDVTYAKWDDPKYDPIPPKKGRKNATAA